MKQSAIETTGTIWSSLLTQAEFLSAIVGAIVGAMVAGLIALLIQLIALREGRKQKSLDHRAQQQALGYALLIKMVRIHTHFCGIRGHLAECQGRGLAEDPNSEAWQYYLPLANPPDAVQFLPDEMGMLLALKDDDIFNLILPLDVVHNTLVTAVHVLNSERIALTERLVPDVTVDATLSGRLSNEQYFALRPRMINVNTLFDKLLNEAKKGVEDSSEAMRRLQKLLQDRLGIRHKFEFPGESNNRRDEADDQEASAVST